MSAVVRDKNYKKSKSFGTGNVPYPVNMAAGKDQRRHMAVLEDVIVRCSMLLDQRDAQEADLRDGFYLLKLAHSEAERVLAGFDRQDWLSLRAQAIETVAMLMKPVREMNPEITTWELARDPTIPVDGRTTWFGPVRTIDQQRVKGVYEAIRNKVWEKLPSIRPAVSDSQPHRASELGGGRPDPLPVQDRPPALPPRQERPVSAPLPGGRTPLNGEAPPESWRPGPSLGGAPGGWLVLPTTDDDTEGWREYRTGQREKAKRRPKDTKYGHQENDLEFFRGAFQNEVSALQNLQLGDDFRYPSDEAFAKYFPEFDFVKAMRGNSLRKWDGTIRDYPSFKHNFNRVIYVQREHYMHKILALEVMVPERIKTELFHGPQYTVEDLGQRLQRLEDRYGGQEKQIKQIVQDLQKLQTKGKVPYTELRAAVEDVDAYLNRSSTLPGTGETLVILLKKVIPKHFRTQYNDVMFQWGKPRTGNSFVEYMKHRLTYEIDEADGGDKREGNNAKKGDENGEKKAGPKTVGKLYQTVAACQKQNETEGSYTESSGEEGDCVVSKGKPLELPDCRCCDEGKHYLHNCRKFFLIFSLREKVAFSKQERICLKCLRYDHAQKECRFKTNPDCRFCESNEHHYLLCPGKDEGAVLALQGDKDGGCGLENMGEIIACKNVSTLQLVANLEAADGRLLPINVLPDTGSTHNILDKKVADKVGLTGFHCKYRVMGHGGHVTEHDAICGEMTLSNPRQPNEKHTLRFYAYDNPCGSFFPEDWGKMKQGWPHLKGLDIPSPVAGEPVAMILGCENLSLFEAIKPPTMRGATDPVARLTSLGWMIGGRTFPEPSSDVTGESRVVRGEVGIVSGGTADKVSETEERINVANYIEPHSLLSLCRLTIQHCTEECKRDYDQLKSNLRRVWELETDEEVNRLTNSHFPAIRSECQKQAEINLMSMRAEHLSSCELWWKGPPFLRRPVLEWPRQPHIRPTKEAAGETRTGEEFVKNIIMVSENKSESGPLTLIKKLLGKGMNVRSALKELLELGECFEKTFRNKKFLRTFEELEHIWIRYEQQTELAKLYDELRQCKRVSNLRELDPRLDSQGVIRVATGLSRSIHHSWETSFPILLHEKMRYSSEMMQYTHAKSLGHVGGVGTLLNQMRKRFYVIGGKKSRNKNHPGMLSLCQKELETDRTEVA